MGSRYPALTYIDKSYKNTSSKCTLLTRYQKIAWKNELFLLKSWKNNPCYTWFWDALKLLLSMGLRLHLQGGSSDHVLGNFFCRKAGQTWERVPSSCAIATLGEVQNLTRHGPEQSSTVSRKLTDFEVGLLWMVRDSWSLRLFQPKLFCGSIKQFVYYDKIFIPPPPLFNL